VLCAGFGYHRRSRGQETDKAMADKPESLPLGKLRPFTGAEYLLPLCDGREIYVYGERVKE
jgi:hypothetical protein